MNNQQNVMNLLDVINKGLLLRQNKEIDEPIFMQWFDYSRMVLIAALGNPQIYYSIEANYLDLLQEMKNHEPRIGFPKIIDYCVEYLQDIMVEL